ncbi:MAG: TraR/DksA C4-type zinc finger protein [Deltaproteobacteria bacterium]|nr:TraR/DksA C4-type zinc finger protein [Deltaproteobacteria bacterium]
MSDEIDLANDQQARLLSAAIQHVAGAAHRQGESLLECLECGDPIPEKRRVAAPGCCYCVTCQQWLDDGGRFHP